MNLSVAMLFRKTNFVGLREIKHERKERELSGQTTVDHFLLRCVLSLSHDFLLRALPVSDNRHRNLQEQREKLKSRSKTWVCLRGEVVCIDVCLEIWEDELQKYSPPCVCAYW